VGEWIKWKAFFALEPTLFHREDWYAAKIVATLKAGQAPGKSFNLEDELIKWTYAKEPKPNTRLRGNAAKAAHFAAMGIYASTLTKQAGLDEQQ
jgi:hypothetical protein